MRAVAFLVAAALSVLGCGRDERATRAASTEGAEATATPPAPSPRADAPGPKRDIRDYMASHFMIALFAHDRLVEGNLDAIREPLAEFAAQRYDGVAPGSWLPWIARIQEAAAIAARAQELAPAAVAVAAIAKDCGGCHEAHGARLAGEDVDAMQPASRPETVPERMRRHAWAIDELWQGLLIPSDETWRAGAEAMASGAPELAPGETSDEDFAIMLAEVRTLGARALEASTPMARAETYGTLLTRCAECHERAEVTRYE